MSSSKPIVAFNEAAHAAAVAAATNAGKPGLKTSELWVSILGASLAAVAGVFIPGLGAAAVPAAMGIVAAGYALSRGNVKAAALAATAAVSKSVPGPIGDAAAAAAAVMQAGAGGAG